MLPRSRRGARLSPWLDRSMDLTLADIVAARSRIAEGIYLSPCPESIPLSEICRGRIFCKLDYLQRTGSFKERGARNALLLLDAAQRQRGVISASAGNHALGLAYHGKLLGIGVTVVMPQYAPLIKRTTCLKLGAKSFYTARPLARPTNTRVNWPPAMAWSTSTGSTTRQLSRGRGPLPWKFSSKCPTSRPLSCRSGARG